MRASKVLRRDRGQVMPLLAVVLLAAGLGCWLMAELGARVIDRAQAQTAADAAALAGAVEGRLAAADVAAANDSSLQSYTVHGDTTSVEVIIDGISAEASARSGGTQSLPAAVGAFANGGDRRGLAPVMLAALARADQLLGRAVPVLSGYRSRAEQQALWDKRASNPFPVAPPGFSSHEQGMAIDVPEHFVAALLDVAADAGLCRPMPDSDPIHFEPCLPTNPME